MQKLFSISLLVVLGSAGCLSPVQAEEPLEIVSQNGYFPAIVLQSQSYSCGPAALATLLGYYGVSVSEQTTLHQSNLEMRSRQKTIQLQGADLLALRESLNDFEIPTLAVTIKDSALLQYFEQRGTPILAHGNYPQGHYFVIVGLLPTSTPLFLIADPSHGYELLDLKELSADKGFEGVALIPQAPSLLETTTYQRSALAWANNQFNQ